MWIFTPTGFVSAVYKNNNLQVRARDAQSLQELANLTASQIIKTPLADYPYRVSISKESFTEWISKQIEALDYPNFKSEIASTRGDNFAKPLNQVWSVMHDVEDSEARSR